MSDDMKTAPAMLSLLDGEGRPFEEPVALRIYNGRDVPPTVHEGKGPNVYIKAPFHDGIGDTSAVCASSDGYRDSGCFFRADPSVLAEPKLLMLRKQAKPQFSPWTGFKAKYPQAASFLTTGVDEGTTETHYDGLSKQRPESLACLLNLTQAMAEIDLAGRSPLSYFKAICWDDSMAQDRFYGYVDPAIIPAVRAAAETGMFSEEKDCAEFHPGATCSWKQIAFGVANVQLTFHENATADFDGMKCIKIEPDIDLYRNILAHGFGEVFPNLLTHGLTNPYAVYALRWTTAQDGDGPLFDPGYGIA
jgi:hypothetical protein